MSQTHGGADFLTFGLSHAGKAYFTTVIPGWLQFVNCINLDNGLGFRELRL